MFSEDASRALLICGPEKVEAIEETALKYGLNAQPIGFTTGRNFAIRIDGETVLEGDVSAFVESWRPSLEQALQTEPEVVKS